MEFQLRRNAFNLESQHFVYCDSANWKLLDPLLYLFVQEICIGNSMISGDIWHKLFHEPLGEWNLRQLWNITSGVYAKYRVQILLLFVYTTTHKSFVIFTCRYFKLTWNTTAQSQSNFLCSSMKVESIGIKE